VLPKASKLLAAMTAAGVVGASLVYSPVNQAFDFGDMMNPGKWMGGGRDRYDDDYGGPYGGPWSGGPYGGGPWGGPYGGGPGGGYGPSPYGGTYGPPGYYGARAYPGVAPSAPVAPATKESSAPARSSSEIDELKRRIEELESQQRPSSAPPPGNWSAAPAPSDLRPAAPFGEGDAPPAAPSTRDWGSAPPFAEPEATRSPGDWGSAPAFRPMEKY
jgi:hypothetical protein